MAQRILHADNSGLSAGVCAGIRQTCRKAIVTSIPGMANMAGAQSRTARPHCDCPGLGIGMHLNITAAAPVRPRSQVAALLGADGRFLGSEILLQRTDERLLVHARREWRVQLESLIAMGLGPDHLECHHHIAFPHPALLEVFPELAQEESCAVRPSLIADLPATSILGSLPKKHVGWFFQEAPEALKRSKVPHPDCLLGSFLGEDATIPVLLGFLESPSPSSSEIMCNPGLDGQNLAQRPSHVAQRAAEVAVLSSSKVRVAAHRGEIQLIRYA